MQSKKRYLVKRTGYVSDVEDFINTPGYKIHTFEIDKNGYYLIVIEVDDNDTL